MCNCCCKFSGEVRNFGVHGCDSYNPCKIGQGGCSFDNDCANGLYCFIRNFGEKVTGFDVSGIPPDFNFCIPVATSNYFEPN